MWALKDICWGIALGTLELGTCGETPSLLQGFASVLNTRLDKEVSQA